MIGLGTVIGFIPAEKAISIKPNYADVYNNIGVVFAGQGDLKKAIESYEKAIKIESDFASAHHNLSALKKYKSNDQQINQMQALLDSNSLNLSSKIYLNFAMAKVYEDIGIKDKMFQFLDKGNLLRKRKIERAFYELVD